MTNSIIKLYERDLNRLKDEISSYTEESELWKINKEIKNSGGNLALHLVGNLNHFIGATLGNTGYIRQREREFNDKNVSKHDIIDQINSVKKILLEILPSLKKEDLSKNYPIDVFGSPMSTEYFLIHLYGHLNYHLGQINYHRRLLE